MQCPQCGSGNTQRLEMIYDAGTQHISATSSTLATGYSHGELVTGTANTTTTGIAQTTLAAKVAPPQKKSIIMPILAIVIGCEAPLWAFAFVRNPTLPLFLGMAMTGAAFVWGIRSFRSNRVFNAVTLPQLQQQWRMSWMCRRCGTVF